MQFSDTSNFLGILQNIDFWILGSSATASTDYAAADKTRQVNNWYNRVVSLILQADGRWEWDDTNHTDLPIATTALVADQQDYEITGATFLKITRVEVKNNAGDYQRISPISQQDKKHIALSEYKETAGMPQEYDKLGNSIFLYPKIASAQVTLAAGLKVYFQRNVSLFAATDTTKVPGFAEPFHEILAMGAARDYCIANDMQSRVAILDKEITKIEAEIIKFYAQRDRDEKTRMTLARENYGSRTANYAVEKPIWY